MRTLILQQPGQLELMNTAEPGRLEADQVLVRVHRVGICGTDIHAFRGRQPFFSYPRILGHELSVEIMELGAPHPQLQIGDRCAVEPYLNCGKCRPCQRGKSNCCTNLQVLGVHVDGGMREFLSLPIEKLHSANTLTWEQIALVETLSIGAHAVQRAQLTAEDRVLIVGAGPIGLTVLQFVLLSDAVPTVMDIDLQRLQFCQTHLNAQATVHCAPDSPQSTLNELRERTNGDLFDVVFDATGNSQSMHQSFDCVGHGGRLILVGLFDGPVTFHDPDFHRLEMTLMASRNSTGQDFRHIISLIENQELDTRPWISHHCTLEEFPGQFPQWLNADSGLLKGLLHLG